MKILYRPHSYSQQRQREKPRLIYPVLMAMEAQWHRQQGHDVCWNPIGPERAYDKFDKIITEPEGLPFLELPAPNREVTRWWEYQENGNFKYHPATYILSANGCWHGKCKFCVENKTKYEVRPVKDVVKEIEWCKIMGFKEVFDDSGTFPTGEWLDDFCNRVAHLKMKIGCNMRFGALLGIDYAMMKDAGFRMLLWGLESANQRTLNKINKGIEIERAKKDLIASSREGLENHICVMFGFPWESEKEALNTLQFVHWALRKGYARTAQASFYTTPEEISNYDHKKYVSRVYHAAFWPDFWFNQLRKCKTKEDLKYIWRGIKLILKERMGSSKRISYT